MNSAPKPRPTMAMLIFLLTRGLPVRVAGDGDILTALVRDASQRRRRFYVALSLRERIAKTWRWQLIEISRGILRSLSSRGARGLHRSEQLADEPRASGQLTQFPR